MAKLKPFNLFVYGTLMDPAIFRAVLGLNLVYDPTESDGRDNFLARPAVLNGYAKSSPDQTYLYAVPDPHGRIRGYVIGPLPGDSISALRKYEGQNYSRKRIKVETAEGRDEAVVFVANTEAIEHSFGYEFRDPFKQEIILGEKIDKALLETERKQLHTEETLARRAVGELHGPTIRDLVRRHFESGGISDYTIRTSLTDPPLRNYDRIRSDPEAMALAPHYLGIVVRQVIFNQIEHRLRLDFHYELEQMYTGSDFYERTISSLATLKFLNGYPNLLSLLVSDALEDLSFLKHELIDFVRWAVIASDTLYNPSHLKQHIQNIRHHMDSGHIPLGAELEFSNIGQDVIRDPQGKSSRDMTYDGFVFFKDFALDVLTWKLGGHLDDHHDKSSPHSRRGFFEVALGNLSIEADLSMPITNDPWILSQIIQEIRTFYPIAPHSVHLSLQLRTQNKPDRDRRLPLPVLKCLFALAGDPAIWADGKLRINRLVSDEIVNYNKPCSMMFSEIRKRFSTESDEQYPSLRTGQGKGRYVQQFRFIRLAKELNYEPIILALKGIQISLRPGSFLLPDQYAESSPHHKLFDQLIAWGQDPQPISEQDIETFLGNIYDGLMNERRGRPAHSEAYIAWAVGQLRHYLRRFNTIAAKASLTESGE